MSGAEIQKAQTKCQPMHFPITCLQCLLRIVEQTARNGTVVLLFLKILRFQGEKKGALCRRRFVVSLGVFFVGTRCIVCVNMAGNVDVKMIGITILWCYSCSSVFNIVCFRTI